MRIWLISKYCRLPGEGVYPARGFSILREMARRGHDATLITARHDWPSNVGARIPGRVVTTVDGVRVVTLNVFRYARAKSLRRILGWLHFEVRLLIMRLDDLPRPDVVIASSLSLFSILNGLLLKLRRRCLLVFEVRDVWPLILTENGGFSRRNPFVLALSLIERWGYLYSDRIVGTMPNLSAHVRRVLGRHKEVACIPMGVPEEMLADEGVDLPEFLEATFPKADFIVTYAGSIGIDNALDTLLDGARLLKDEDRIGFFIIGKGDLVDRYKSRCADLPRVVFADPVSNSYVQPVLRRSSVLYFAAHPTMVLEYGQSLNKLIDYMYSGRPVLGSYSGFPSMINEAGCGEFVPAGDAHALVRALLNWADRPSAELDAMGARGRAWVLSNRSYERLTDDYLALLGFSEPHSLVADNVPLRQDVQVRDS
jgi:glycosyltransferase involved in cell wall biosynthesis